MVLDEQSLERCGCQDASGGHPWRERGLVRVAATQATGISKDSGASPAQATGQLRDAWDQKRGCATCQGSQSRAGKLRPGSGRAT